MSGLAPLTLLLLVATAQAREPVRSLWEYRTEGVIIQRWDISCGAAALATVLTFDLNHPVTEEVVARGMLRQTDPLRVKVRGGFSLLDMKRFASAAGFEADGYEQVTFEDLPDFLPAIVPIKLRGYDHFIVVRKIERGRVYVADPGFGRYDQSEAKFRAEWKGIAFVVKRKGES